MDRYHAELSGGEWTVRQEDSGIEPERFATQKLAWTQAQVLAQENSGQALLHDERGRISHKKVYRE